MNTWFNAVKAAKVTDWGAAEILVSLWLPDQQTLKKINMLIRRAAALNITYIQFYVSAALL